MNESKNDTKTKKPYRLGDMEFHIEKYIHKILVKFVALTGIRKKTLDLALRRFLKISDESKLKEIAESTNNYEALDEILKDCLKTLP